MMAESFECSLAASALTYATAVARTTVGNVCTVLVLTYSKVFSP